MEQKTNPRAKAFDEVWSEESADGSPRHEARAILIQALHKRPDLFHPLSD